MGQMPFMSSNRVKAHKECIVYFGYELLTASSAAAVDWMRESISKLYYFCSNNVQTIFFERHLSCWSDVEWMLLTYRSCCWYLLQQTTEPSFPETLLIAINKQGVNLLDPETKVSASGRTDIYLPIFVADCILSAWPWSSELVFCIARSVVHD